MGAFTTSSDSSSRGLAGRGRFLRCWRRALGRDMGGRSCDGNRQNRWNNYILACGADDADAIIALLYLQLADSGFEHNLD